MGNQPTNPVLQFLHRLTVARDAEAEADAILLERFVLHRDEMAFAALVQRHGSLVLGVCRRVLRHEQDAEDAFQATFLVLACRARSILRRQSVGSWLHGVACRVALKARARAARRRAGEVELRDLPMKESTPDILWRDLRPVLDEEVNRLPARYRTPFVLCYFQGLTQEQAARQLGRPPGTVAAQLSRARERLRTRLSRRGLALSGSVAVMGLAETAAPAAVPAALAATTTRAAVLVTAGTALAAGAIPVEVNTLLQGALKAMWIKKVLICAVICLSLGLFGAGGSVLAHRLLAAQPSEAPRKELPEQKPKEQSKEQPKPADTEAKELRDLLQARLEAAKTEFEALQQFHAAGRATADILYDAAQRYLKSQLELSDQKAERVAAHQAHLERMKQLAEIVKAQFDAGRASIADASMAEYYRLDAEIELRRAKTR